MRSSSDLKLNERCVNEVNLLLLFNYDIYYRIIIMLGPQLNCDTHYRIIIIVGAWGGGKSRIEFS